MKQDSPEGLNHPFTAQQHSRFDYSQALLGFLGRGLGPDLDRRYTIRIPSIRDIQSVYLRSEIYNPYSYGGEQ